jgi:hypothetical protein
MRKNSIPGIWDNDRQGRGRNPPGIVAQKPLIPLRLRRLEQFHDTCSRFRRWHKVGFS